MSGKRSIPLGMALVIPSYNPDDRLFATVKALSDLEAERIIVVNDGSSTLYDGIFSEVEKIPGVTLLRHEKNEGKGAALKTGMSYVLSSVEGLRGVITVDGDGHHRPADVVACAQKLQASGQVILGQRGRKDLTLSKRGRFGNRLTSMAIDFVCDFDIPDPLSGLRGIPLRYLPILLQTKGKAYDFESNMILDLKRHNIPFRTFSITGEYFADGSTSHYRPVRDTVNISLELMRFFGQQFKYLGSSLVCYMAEYVLFRMLLGYLPEIGVTFSNYISRLLAGGANFLINKHIVFGVKQNHLRTILRYILLVLLVMLISTELIVLINMIFHTENNTVAKFIKIPVDTVMFFFSYYLQKKWVFSDKRHRG